MNFANELLSKAIPIILSLSIWKDIIILILGVIIPIIWSMIKNNYLSNHEENGNHSLHRKPVFSLCLLLIILGLLFSGYIYIGYSYTMIPDIVGTDHEYAERQLSASGLKYSQFYGRPGDVVISVGGGDYAKKGAKIELTYGRVDVDGHIGDTDNENIDIMPDFYLVSEQSAYVYLLAMGYDNIKTLTQYSENMVQGYVIRTEPKAGENIVSGDEIILYVSTEQNE